MAQSQAAVACPPQSCPPAPAVEGYPPPGNFAAPPPPGYPGAEYAAGQQQSQTLGATTSRGVSAEGCIAFLKGIKVCCSCCVNMLGA